MTGDTHVQPTRKVVFIAPRFHTNQAAIVRYLVESGVDVSFYVAGIGKSEVHRDVIPVPIGFVNHILLRRWMNSFDENPYFNLYRYGLPRWSNIQSLLQQRPDLAIIRAPITMVGIISSLLLKTRGTKLVFYTQTPVYRCNRWFKDRLLNLFARLMGAVWITPCRGQASLGAPLTNSYFLPFTAFPHRYDKKWFQDGRVAILMVGKFLPRKRHDLLLSALACLPDPSAFRVTFVGELSDVTGSNTMGEIMTQIRQMNFQVDIHTNLPYKAVTTLYRSHDLFVLPSEKESASVSNLEAMSYGLPVILSSCNRTCDYAGPAGWIFRSRSVEDLARVLHEAVSNRTELKRRGTKAWEIVDLEFMPDRVYRPFFDTHFPLD